MKTQQNRKERIARLSSIFQELGADVPPVTDFREARLLADSEPGHGRYETSELCGKAMYPTESEARGAAKARKKKGAGFLRIYFCHDCHSFHLTKIPNQKR